jgi:hypothetical protein
MVGRLEAQVGWRGDNTGRKYGGGKLEECISAAREACVEDAARLTQGFEVVRRVHGGSYCYRQLREATLCRRFVPAQLKHNSLLKNSLYARFRPRSGTKHTGFGALQARFLVVISSTPTFSTG